MYTHIDHARLLVVVLVAAVALAAALADLGLELVLLVAAEVRVGHEVEGVGVGAGLGRHKVQLELGLLLQGEALDGEQRVGLGLADDDPPALLALRGEVRRDDGTCRGKMCEILVSNVFHEHILYVLKLCKCLISK